MKNFQHLLKPIGRTLLVVPLFSLIAVNAFAEYYDSEEAGAMAGNSDYRGGGRSAPNVYGEDCVGDCAPQFYGDSVGSLVVDGLGAVAAPLALVGSTWLSSYYQNQSQKKWAEAYSDSQAMWGGYYKSVNALWVGADKRWADVAESIPKECTTQFNAYMSYLDSRGAAAMLPEQAQGFTNQCASLALSLIHI